MTSSQQNSSVANLNSTAAQSNSRTGLLLGVGAYASWGVFPAFFQLLKDAGAVEILAQRVIWTALFMAAVITVGRRWSDLRSISVRVWWLLAAASALIALNWGTYIFAVNNGHVVDAALGYFITPLVSVMLGLVVFRERLTAAQWVALVIAAVAVLVLGFELGAVPYVGLALALSFGAYGAVKKVVTVDPRVSVGVEAALAAPVAVAYLAILGANGTFLGHGAGHAALLVITGVVTALPLLMFAGAAQRLPLVTLGLLMYLNPGMQMAYGILVGHEPMAAARWVGFGLIWLALAVFTADAVASARRQSTR